MVGVVVPSVGDMSTAVYDSNEDGQIAEDAIINEVDGESCIYSITGALEA